MFSKRYLAAEPLSILRSGEVNEPDPGAFGESPILPVEALRITLASRARIRNWSARMVRKCRRKNEYGEVRETEHRTIREIVDSTYGDAENQTCLARTRAQGSILSTANLGIRALHYSFVWSQAIALGDIG